MPQTLSPSANATPSPYASTATTRGIRVDVEPEYLAQQSDPKRGLWVFAYHITLTNSGTETVQLLSRHWIISDASGKVEHVRGPGVVGQQPILRPGERYSYSSGCPLHTSLGTMYGTYQMISSNGERFDIEIAPFTLAEPGSLN